MNHATIQSEQPKPAASQGAALLKNTAHIPALDGLRGMAILLVLAYHFMGYSSNRGMLLRGFFALNRTGWIGVDLFFVLSGFLITRILLEALQSRNYFRNFYMRRTLRIFPLYYLTLLVVFAAGWVIPALRTGPAREVASHQAWLWLYGTNIGDAWHGRMIFAGGWIELNHLWSLAIEEQFYLVWAPVVLFCGPRRLLPTCIAVIIVALALRMTLWIDGKPDVLAYMLTPCRMDTLAVGALLATLHRRTSSPRQLTAWAWAILLAGTSLLAGWAFRAGGLDHADPVVWTVGFTMIALAFGALIHLVAVSGDRSRVFAFARNPLLRSVGKYSYAIYIFHWLLAPGLYAHLLPEQWFFKHLRYVPGLLARFALVTALTYGIALVTWNLFEKQFLKLKRFYAYDKSSRKIAVARAQPAAIGLAATN